MNALSCIYLNKFSSSHNLASSRVEREKWGIFMLTQSDIDLLLNMIKQLKSNDKIVFPPFGTEIKLDVISTTTKDKFIIDISRKGYIKINRCTYQTRYQKSIILLRLDVNGPPHTNPDGEVIPCPHLHIYREGYESKWAFPLQDKINVQNPDDLIEILIRFLEYNKISNIPEIEEQMFLF